MMMLKSIIRLLFSVSEYNRISETIEWIEVKERKKERKKEKNSISASDQKTGKGNGFPKALE